MLEKCYQTLDEVEQTNTDDIFTTTINKSKQNKKDLALCHTEQNPFINLFSNFLGVIQNNLRTVYL